MQTHACLVDGQIKSMDSLKRVVRDCILAVMVLSLIVLACGSFTAIATYGIESNLREQMLVLQTTNEELHFMNARANSDLLTVQKKLDRIAELAQSQHTSSQADTVFGHCNLALLVISKVLHDRTFVFIAHAINEPVAMVFTAGYWATYSALSSDTMEQVFNTLEPVGVWVGSGLAHTMGAVLSAWFEY